MMNLHKCERCPALVRLSQKRCKPCQGDVIAELHKARERKARERKRLERNESLATKGT